MGKRYIVGFYHCQTVTDNKKEALSLVKTLPHGENSEPIVFETEDGNNEGSASLTGMKPIWFRGGDVYCSICTEFRCECPNRIVYGMDKDGNCGWIKQKDAYRPILEKLSNASKI